MREHLKKSFFHRKFSSIQFVSKKKLLMIDMINGKIKAPIPNAGDLDAMKLTIMI